jgi:hypothetical protein
MSATTAAVYERHPDCRCGDLWLSHVITRKRGVRGECTRHNCGCTKYQPAKEQSRG